MTRAAGLSAWRAIAAATVLNLPLGSLYAFSVLIQPLERLLDLSRAELALVFGLATIGLTAGMNAAPYVYRSVPPIPLLLVCAGLTAAGIALAATAGGLLQLIAGYSVFFGLGGGIAYIVGQQAVNLSVTTRRGLANGYVVALYPAGAMIAAPVFGWSIGAFGVRRTLAAFAAGLLVTGVTSARLIAGVRLTPETGATTPEPAERQRALFWRLTINFFLAASAGLMVLSQAAGIIAAYGGALTLAVYGTTFITGMIAGARIGGGWMADWLSVPSVATGAHVIALAGNVALTLWPGPAVSVLSLTLVGVGYGLISGVTAAAVGVYWRRALYGLIVSRVYVAWCAAAIVLPVIAGRLFDATRSYRVAILVAAACNVFGIFVSLGLPRQSRSGDE
jgi:OFA family oxalate/formate antiporter-like MFS transporter